MEAKANKKERVTLTVSGVELNLVTEESSEYMQKLAEEIDRRITDIVVGNTRINKIDAALFCALDHLDMLHKQRAELKAEKERAEKLWGELMLLKQENIELKTLLGGNSCVGGSEEVLENDKEEETE